MSWYEAAGLFGMLLGNIAMWITSSKAGVKQLVGRKEMLIFAHTKLQTWQKYWICRGYTCKMTRSGLGNEKPLLPDIEHSY